MMQPKPIPKPKQKEQRCKIVIRKSQDGKVISKEVSGECSKEQLQALQDIEK